MLARIAVIAAFLTVLGAGSADAVSTWEVKSDPVRSIDAGPGGSAWVTSGDSLLITLAYPRRMTAPVDTRGPGLVDPVQVGNAMVSIRPDEQSDPVALEVVDAPTLARRDLVTPPGLVPYAITSGLPGGSTFYGIASGSSNGAMPAGLYRYDLAGGEPVLVRDLSGAGSSARIVLATDGGIWSVEATGYQPYRGALVRLDPLTGETLRIPLTDGTSVEEMVAGPSGDVWLATSQGEAREVSGLVNARRGADATGAPALVASIQPLMPVDAGRFSLIAYRDFTLLPSGDLVYIAGQFIAIRDAQTGKQRLVTPARPPFRLVATSDGDLVYSSQTFALEYVVTRMSLARGGRNRTSRTLAATAGVSVRVDCASAVTCNGTVRTTLLRKGRKPRLLRETGFSTSRGSTFTYGIPARQKRFAAVEKAKPGSRVRVQATYRSAGKRKRAQRTVVVY